MCSTFFWKQNSINKSGYNTHKIDTNRIPKQVLQCKPIEEETLGDGGNDGKINCTLRVKERALWLTFQSS